MDETQRHVENDPGRQRAHQHDLAFLQSATEETKKKQFKKKGTRPSSSLNSNRIPISVFAFPSLPSSSTADHFPGHWCSIFNAENHSNIRLRNIYTSRTLDANDKESSQYGEPGLIQATHIKVSPPQDQAGKDRSVVYKRNCRRIDSLTAPAIGRASSKGPRFEDSSQKRRKKENKCQSGRRKSKTTKHESAASLRSIGLLNVAVFVSF